MEKTYTITVTYEAQLTTENYTEEDIENALWVGDLEIGLIRRYNGNISIRGDATDIDIQEE